MFLLHSYIHVCFHYIAFCAIFLEQTQTNFALTWKVVAHLQCKENISSLQVTRKTSEGNQIYNFKMLWS